MTPQSKPWYLSRSIWFSLLTLAASVLVLITKTFPTSAGALAGLASLINILIRFDTSLPIS